MQKSIKISAGILGLLFFLNLIATPFWRITHDTVFIHYVTMLMDYFNKVPYLEIYDTSMPGTWLFHIFIAKFFGYTEAGLQFFNFIFTIVFFFVNFFVLWNLPLIARLVGSFYFLLVYQTYGQEMSLQRDVIGCLFIAISFLAATHPWFLTRKWIKNFLIGLNIGIAMAIKPQFAIGLPFLFLYGEISSIKELLRPKFNFFIHLFICGMGVILPLVGCYIWLVKRGALDEFWLMQKIYIPQYIELGAGHTYFSSKIKRVLANYKSFIYLLPYWRFGFFILAMGALLNIVHDQKNKRFWILTFILALTYSLTLIVSGQYFPYHFMSFFLFSFYFVTGFFNSELTGRAKNLANIGLIIILLNMAGQIPIETIKFLKGEKPHIGRNGRVDRLIKAMEDNIQPNDTIQVFDWIEGATSHAMMNLKRDHKYRFITDHIFKHHLQTESKKKINADYLAQMKAEKPNIIIMSLKHNYPKGEFTSKSLPEDYLDFINHHYSKIFHDEDFDIYRLN